MISWLFDASFVSIYHNKWWDMAAGLCFTHKKIMIILKFKFYGIVPLKSIVRSILCLCETRSVIKHLPWWSRPQDKYMAFHQHCGSIDTYNQPLFCVCTAHVSLRYTCYQDCTPAKLVEQQGRRCKITTKVQVKCHVEAETGGGIQYSS